jgi:hypothetical protein
LEACASTDVYCGFAFLINTDHNISARIGGGPRITSGRRGCDAGTIPVGEWTLVAANFTGTTDYDFKLFVNGSVQTPTCSGGATAMTWVQGPALIGGTLNSSGEYAGFAGHIDDLRVYSRALEEDEVAQLAADPMQ